MLFPLSVFNWSDLSEASLIEMRFFFAKSNDFLTALRNTKLTNGGGSSWRKVIE
jgi:hypothetical protein